MTILIFRPDNHARRERINARNRRNHRIMESMLRDAFDDEGYSGYAEYTDDQVLSELMDAYFQGEHEYLISKYEDEYHAYRQRGGIHGWRDYIAPKELVAIECFILESPRAMRFTRTEREGAFHVFLGSMYR